MVKMPRLRAKMFRIRWRVYGKTERTQALLEGWFEWYEPDRVVDQICVEERE